MCSPHSQDVGTPKGMFSHVPVWGDARGRSRECPLQKLGHSHTPFDQSLSFRGKLSQKKINVKLIHR
jgi:hypothetical protein